MADKTTETSDKLSTVKRITEDKSAVEEYEMKNDTLCRFFVSAIKNVYNTENEDLQLTDASNAFINSEVKQED